MKTFDYQLRIHFGQIDAAGIVFYPRFFEMVNETVETWFRKELDYAFAAMHGTLGSGVPTVELKTKFLKPVRLEQVMTWKLSIVKITDKSVDLEIAGTVDGANHVEVESTLVHVSIANDGNIKSSPWPDAVREKMLPYMADA